MAPEKVLGVIKTEKSLVEGTPHYTFAVTFSDGSVAYVPRKKAHKLYPQLVISYYESCIYFSSELETVDSIKEASELKEARETVAAPEYVQPEEEKTADGVTVEEEDPLVGSSTLLSIKTDDTTEAETSAMEIIPGENSGEVFLISSIGE